MGLFDLLANFDPDEIVKKFDDFEQVLDKAIDNVSSSAEKVEKVAGSIEQKALGVDTAKTVPAPEIDDVADTNA